MKLHNFSQISVASQRDQCISQNLTLGYLYCEEARICSKIYQQNSKKYVKEVMSSINLSNRVVI